MLGLAGKRVWVAGHRGMVGSALCRRLASERVEIQREHRAGHDLRNGIVVRSFLHLMKPQIVIVAAARVGGIEANRTRPADFLYDNLMIAANVIHASAEAGVEKLLFLGSSCIYPRDAEQPIREDSLLTGPLESTNEAYAIAKIAGVKLCQAYRRQHGCDFISAMPTNLYGPGDRFDEDTGHVIPALIARMHRAKMRGDPEVTVWGSGRPLREFLHVADLADACVYLLKHYSGEQPVNVGSGLELSIEVLATIMREVVGYEGRIVSDPSKPDGTPRKLLDSSVICELGWTPTVGLTEGLAETYRWYCERKEAA